jgi:hypothetical protein
MRITKRSYLWTKEHEHQRRRLPYRNLEEPYLQELWEIAKIKLKVLCFNTNVILAKIYPVASIDKSNLSE